MMRRRGWTRRGLTAALGAMVIASLSACAGRASTPDDRTPDSAPVVEPWSFRGDPGTLTRTRYWRVFSTADDSTLNSVLPGFLERCMARYRTELGSLPAPALRLDTFVLRDRAAWADLTRQAMGPDANAFLAIERGGFSSGGRGLFWNVGLRDTLSLAAHEGWHQYTQRTFRDELPVWLEEGLATYFEGFRIDPREPGERLIQFDPRANRERWRVLADAAQDGRLMPLSGVVEAPAEALVQSDDATGLLLYAQAWALVLFLKEDEQGRWAAGLSAALRDAAEGRLHRWIEYRAGQQAAVQTRTERRGAGLLTAYISQDISLLEARYDAFVRALARAPQSALDVGVFTGVSMTGEGGTPR